MLGILYTLTLFWICVHGTQLYYGRNTHASTLLPSAHAVKARWYSRMSWRKMEVIIRPLNINVSSTYFNEIHNHLELYFKQQGRLWSRWMTRVYDVGIVLGVVGQISAVVLVAFTIVQLSLSLLSSAQDSAAMENPRAMFPSHLKRQAEEMTTTVTSGPQGSSATLLQPIIPGVTVPASHTWPILLALFVSQVIHEAGHFVATAMQVYCSTSIHSVGASFVVALPAAFVALDAHSLSTRSNFEQLRVITAGAFHNVISYALLVLCASSGVGSIMMTILGYTNTSQSGLVVVDVDSTSGLSFHLSQGSIITQLDDLSLATSNPQDIWTEYLLGSSHQSELGWCLDRSKYQAAGTLCCQPQKPVSVPPEAPVSCFVPIMKPRIDQSSGCCLDPVPILTPSHEDAIYVRCRTDSSCSDSQVCIALGEMEQLMRITSRPSAWDAASSTSPSGTQMRVILWDGPRDEVFEEVSVSTFMPQFSWMPFALPMWMAIFFEYLELISLSLYIFNLLPLPFLDGSELLSGLLEHLLEGRESQPQAHLFDQLETAQNRSPPAARHHSGRGYKERLRNIITQCTVLLIGSAMILGVLASLRAP